MYQFASLTFRHDSDIGESIEELEMRKMLENIDKKRIIMLNNNEKL